MKKIILDTDIGPDCDDAAALAMLNIYANQGRCRILGITHCTSNPYGAGTIDAICRYYGRNDVTIGTYYGEEFWGDCTTYNQYITTHYPNRYKTEQPEEAVGMYRRILSGQEDKSVEFIAIGPLRNLSNLLRSGADEYSPLDGMELVEKKVSKLTIMGGMFQGSSEEHVVRAEVLCGMKADEIAEWNIRCDIEASRNVAENWHTPKTFLGLEAGMFLIGGCLKTDVEENHPVRIAYQLYSSSGERYCWDLLAVESAVIEDSPHYKRSQPGQVRFDEKGRTLYTPMESGADCFVELAQPDEVIIKDIHHLLIRNELI